MPDPSSYSEQVPPAHPSFREAVLFWFRLGFISFGGPAGQIAIMHEFLVDRKRWISNAKFLHALNYCMILPGPEAQQLATYSGWLLHGVRGGLAAGILFILPSVCILLGMSTLYVVYGSIPWVYALFTGLKPAVVAIVLLALVRIAGKSLHHPVQYSVAALSFLALFVFHVSFPFVMLGAALVGLAVQRVLPHIMAPAAHHHDKQEEGYLITRATVIPQARFSLFILLRRCALALLLWSLPFLVFHCTRDAAFWTMFSLFFTRAALVTFGGAYAVLPYVAQVSVEQLHWLTRAQMIDGLALGETTPGPLIMVLTFVGFMGAYHHGGSLLWGIAGLLITTFYTFLPCFLFIFAGAPLIERTQNNARVQTVMNIITATVVGVILNLTLYLGQVVIFPHTFSLTEIDYFSMGWILLSVIALRRFSLNMILWIGVSALAGLLRFLLVG